MRRMVQGAYIKKDGDGANTLFEIGLHRVCADIGPLKLLDFCLKFRGSIILII
jgi:hypothetical protein